MIRPRKHPRTGVYWVGKGVPAALRAVVGKTELVQSLATKDPTEAKRRAWPVIDQFEAVIEAARRGERLEASPRTTPSKAQAETASPTVILPLKAPEAGHPALGAGTPRSAMALKAGDLLAAWQMENRPAPATAKKYRTSFDQFSKIIGFDDLHRVTEEHVVAFKMARFDAGRHPGTIADDIAACGTVCKWAVKNRMLSSNPFTGMSPRVSRRGAASRDGYTDAEARQILKAAKLETGWQRWLPWLLAFTGARISEIVGLRRMDVRHETGVWILDICPVEGREGKNETFQRMLPIHPAVLADGFLDYIESHPGPDAAPLLYDIPAARDGTLMTTVHRVHGRWIRKTVGISDTRKAPAHSWRHRMEDELRKIRADPEVMDAITGRHNPRNAGAGYGRGFRRMPDEVLKELQRIPSPCDTAAPAISPSSAPSIESVRLPTPTSSVAAAPEGSLLTAAKSKNTSTSLALVVKAWFQKELDRAYETISDPSQSLVSSAPDDDRDVSLQHARDVASDYADHRLAQLQADMAVGDLVAGRAVIRQLLAAADVTVVPSRLAIDRAAYWAMHALAAIEEARSRWAAGELGFRPELPDPKLFRGQLTEKLGDGLRP